MHESHNRVDNYSLLTEIQVLECVQGQIQNVVINKVTRDLYVTLWYSC
jgi:hypothetical protein